jgi:hypothetical protein
MFSSPHLRPALFCVVAVLTSAAIERGHAGEADVIDVTVRSAGSDRFDFDVTVRSNDTGWSHYADKIEVLAPDGSVLGTRVLLHPHEAEQPFTRDVYGVAVPSGIAEVVVRAHHKPTGYDGAVMTVRLPR